MTVRVKPATRSRLCDTWPLRRASRSFFADAGSDFCSVSSFTALVTQWVAARWYHGGWAWKKAQARAFARSFFACAAVNFAGLRRSCE